MIYKKLIFILIILLLLIPPVLAYNGTYAVSSYQGGNVTRTSVNTTVAENVSDIRTRAGTAVDLTSLTSSTGVTISSTAIGNPVGVENLSTMYRGALAFDMRSIPRNATIVNATLILYMIEKRTALGSPDIVITNFSPLDPTNFVSGDYVRVMNGSGIPEYSTRITNASWTSGTNKSIYLNAAGLAALNATRNGGTLKTFNISLRTAWDVDNTTSGILWQPNEGAVYTFATRESATFVNDPILIVNYTLSDTINPTPYNDTFKLIPMTDGNTTRTSDNAAAVGENMSRVRNWSGTAVNYIDNDMLVGVMRSASITAPNANNVTAQSRGYMTYDVGKLPDNATVINATLILHLKTKITTLGSPDIIITNGSPLDPTNFVSGDYVRVPNISANTPEYADRILNSSWTIGQNKSIFLNATGIAALNASRSGIGLFNISIRTAWDVDNSTTGMSVAATTLRSATYTFGTRESVSPIEDPILIINYTLPEGGGVSDYNETYTGRVYRDGNLTRTSVNTTVAENVSDIRTRAGTAIDQTSTAFTIGTKTSSTVIGFKNENLSTMHRAFFDFNGAEIPNNATIVNATLVIYLANKRTALGSPDIVLSNATPLDPTNYVSGDYVRVMNGSTGIPEYSTRITNASWTSGTNKSIYLNAAGLAALNATRTGGGFGLFNLSFRTAWDIDNTTSGILWQRDRTMYDFATREAVLSWQDPMLIINYSMPDPPVTPQSYYNESVRILTRFTGNSTRTSENAAAVGENFSRSRNWTGGLLDNSSTDLLVGVMRSASITAPNANNITANARGETTFNVGEIPINATIVNSTLVLYLKTKITTLGSPDIVITNATPLDPTLYTGSDYVAKFPNVSANTPEYADRILNSSWTIGQNKSIFLNSVGLTALNNSRSGSGMFNLTIRTAWDVDNSTTGMSVVATTLRSATYTFGSSRSVNFIEDPILIVNYTLPSSESGISIPNASYIINKSFGTEPQDVQFNDTSTGSPDIWNWSLGDGTWQNITKSWANITDSYSHFGNYSIYLMVNNTAGVNDTIYSPQWINITESMKTNMTANITGGQQPLPVQFNDASTNATIWNWSFGDGLFSNSQNPIKIYNNFGLFDISLNASSSTSFNTTTFIDWINVTESMKTNMTANVTKGTQPLVVQFNDISTNATLWNWSFGDGTYSVSQNPVKQFVSFGLYSISLNASSDTSFNITTFTNWINVTESMTTDFCANITSGMVPLPVQFTDLSTNATLWNWSFGDTTFSELQNPVKIYSSTGVFTVSLNASTDTDFAINTKTGYITVTGIPPNSSYTVNASSGTEPRTILFTDTSSYSPSTWNLSYGDGTWYNVTGTFVAQSHIYPHFSNYSTYMIVNNTWGLNSSIYSPQWINITESMKTEFGANITSGMVPLPVQFTDSSTNATVWNWSFGDTTFSELQNPIKVYTSSGIYNVALNASSDTSFNITTKTGYITVTGIPPNSSYTVNASSGTEPRTILFTDTSSYSPSTWNLSYGDGAWYNVTGTFVAQSHTYLHFGDYQTYMITNSTWGINSSLYSPQWINITESMKTNMTASVTKGQQPLSVQFNDISTNATVWNWSFGDGTYSVSQNPLKQYVSFGLYTVSLNASTITSYNTTTFTNWINVTESMKTEFGANITSGMVPLPVQFTDLSTNATSWNWSFGDGNFSNLQNPIKTYSVVGTFTVVLNASSDTSYNTTIKTDYITTVLPMTADFTADHTSGIGSLLVQFTDMSIGSPTSWLWNFGDGITSSLQNPQHNYVTFGVYTVSLNASTPLTFDIEQKNNYIIVYETITAGFTQDTTLGAAPLTVTFTDLSNNATSWDWDYGDGTAHGNTKNPSHNYLSAGIYTVNLTASNAGDSDIISKTNLITVYDPILASFTSNDTSTCRFPPVSTQFNDTSSGLPTSWLWSFGDGGSSTVQNATHIYNNFGNFTVSLDASNTYASDSEIKVAYICLLENLTANFVYSPSIGESPLNVSFTDTSNNATSWAWDFGDGNGSILQNPYYVYPFAGTFDVTLTVDDAKGLTDSKTIIGAIKAYKPAEPHQVIQLPEKTRYYVDFYIWIIFFILVLGMIVISHVGKQDTLNIIFSTIGFLASIFVMYGSLGLAYYTYIPYNTTSNITVYANNTTIHSISTEYISVIRVITANWLTIVCAILLIASLINMVDIIGGYFERKRNEL